MLPFRKVLMLLSQFHQCCAKFFKCKDVSRNYFKMAMAGTYILNAPKSLSNVQTDKICCTFQIFFPLLSQIAAVIQSLVAMSLPCCRCFNAMSLVETYPIRASTIGNTFWKNPATMKKVSTKSHNKTNTTTEIYKFI